MDTTRSKGSSGGRSSSTAPVPKTLNPAVLNKFIAPPEYQQSFMGYGSSAGSAGGVSLPPATGAGQQTVSSMGTMGPPPAGGTMGSASYARSLGATNKNALEQVPPIERGELPRFQTVARGTSNPLAQMGSIEEQQAMAPQNQRIRTSLDQIWLKGQFAKAPQVQDVDPKILQATTDPKVSKTTKIIKFIPEKFERGAVRRPRLEVTEVDTELVFGDPSAALDADGNEGKIQNPALRRWAHDTAVNARQGKQALKEALMARNKMIKTCRYNYPHGALGCAESPYNPGDQEGIINEDGKKVYETGSRLERETKLAARKGKGGGTPSGTLGGLLKGEPPAVGEVAKRGGKKTDASKTGSFNLAAMVGLPSDTQHNTTRKVSS